MPPERDFRKWISMNAEKEWLIQPIETVTGSGIPDLFICVHGYQCWAELKATESPHCYMRISQWRWFNKLTSRGGFGILVIRRLKDKRVDVFLASRLAKIKPEDCTLKGEDIVFPDTIRPAFSYFMGTGNKQFFAKLVRLFEDNYDC